MAAQLSSAQLRQVRQRYERTNEEWREEWLDGPADKRLRHRIKQAVNRLEDFYGRADPAQRALVEQWITASSFQPAASYAERLRRQKDSLQTFEHIAQMGRTTPSAQKLLHTWLERAFDPPDASYRAYKQTLWQENCAGFAKFHNSTSTEQRQKFARNLERYENDFRSLLQP